MDLLDETTTPVAQEAPAAPPKRRWPLITGACFAGVIVVTGVVHGLGASGAMTLGAVVAAACAGALILWRWPQLRKHFGFGRGSMKRSSSRRVTGGGKKGKLFGGSGRKGKGLLGKLGGGRKGGGKGLLGGKGRVGSLLGKGRSRGKSLLGRGGKLLGGKSGSGRSGRKNPLARLGAASGRAARSAARKAASAARKAAKGGSGGGSKRKPAAAIGRGIRAAWKRSRAISGKRAAARAAAGKPPRRFAGPTGVVGAALLSPFIGAALAGKKIRAWWRKRRARNRQTPDGPPAEADATAPAEPPVRQPGAPLEPGTTDTGTSPTRRREPVVSSAIDNAAEGIGAIGSFEPENMADLEQFLSGLPQVHEALADSLTRIADRFCEEYPVAPAVVEHIHEMAAIAAGQVEYAGETATLFRTHHEEDFRRIEDPRPGESFTDVSQQ